MGNSQAKISVLKIPKSQLQSHSIAIQTSLYAQPFRQFKSEYHKKSAGNEQESLILIKSPEEDYSFTVTQPRFMQIEDAYQERTKNFEIQGIIFDEYYSDRVTYLVKDDQFDKTILIRDFQTYDSHVYGNIACEVHINQEMLLPEPSKYILCLTNNYLVQSESVNFPNSNTQIMEFEPVAASLAEMIKYRRENCWEWTEIQFNQLVYQLSKALEALHVKQISHNDIRPENIFYSLEKKCYLLGQFSYAVKGVKKGNLRGNRASTFYVAPQANSIEKYDFHSADVFALGVTLLSALYLCNPIDVASTQKFNNKYSDIKGFKAVEAMLASVDQRKTISQILKKTFDGQPGFSNKDMSHLIQSLRFKTKPKNKHQRVYKGVTSQFYKRTGLWQEWMEITRETLEEHNLNNYEHAQLYKEIALIYYFQDELEDATLNAKKAAKIYRQMGENALKEGNINLALKNFTFAVDCSKYYMEKNDIDLAKSLKGLSKVHAEKRQEAYSKIIIKKAKTIVEKQASKDSLVYASLLKNEAQLERKFFKYSDSLKTLDQAQTIAARMGYINQRASKKVEAEILTLRAKNEISLTRESQNQAEKKHLLDRAQDHLNDAKDIYQQFNTEDFHLELAENTQVLGQVFLEREHFEDAKTCFQKSLEMRRWYQENKKQQKFITEHGVALSNLGRCQRLSNTENDKAQFKAAIEHQEEALQIFKNVFGSDHNYYSACTLKELGQVYGQMGMDEKSQDCFQLSKKILGELFEQGEQIYQKVGVRKTEKLFRQ